MPITILRRRNPAGDVLFSARILSSATGGYLAVPAGMMQTPVYSPSVPCYINSGGLGSLVGEHLAAFTVTNNGTVSSSRTTTNNDVTTITVPSPKNVAPIFWPRFLSGRTCNFKLALSMVVAPVLTSTVRLHNSFWCPAEFSVRWDVPFFFRGFRKIPIS